MIAVRPCSIEHLDDVVELNIAVQSLHAEQHPDLFKSTLCKIALREFYQELLHNKEHFIHIALKNQSVVGYLWCELVQSEESLFTKSFTRLKIHHISVYEQHKNAGIGKGVYPCHLKMRVSERLGRFNSRHVND